MFIYIDSSILLIIRIIYIKTSTIVWIVAIIIILIFGGWYFIRMKSSQTKLYPSKNMDLSSSVEQKNIEQKSVMPIIKVSSGSNLGSYLVSSNGMTLYMFTKDVPNVSNCYNTCAVNWPAYSASFN